MTLAKGPGRALPGREALGRRWAAWMDRWLRTPDTSRGALDFWRERILDLILLLGATLGIMAYLPGVLVSLEHRLWGGATVDTLAYAWIVTAAFRRSWSFSIRAQGLLAVCYFLALTLLLRKGSMGVGMLWMTGLPIAAAILLGIRTSVRVWLLAACTLVLLGLAIHQGTFLAATSPSRTPGSLLAQWTVYSANALFLSAVLSLPTGLLLRSLESANRSLSRAEEALRSTAQRLQLATASARLGVWDWDTTTHQGVWDARTCEIYGVEATDFGTRSSTWESRLHPEDRARAEANSHKALEGPGDYQDQYRVVHPDGTIHHVKVDGVVVRDGKGRALRMTGLARDVTAAQEAQAEQRRLEMELQHAQRLDSLGSLAGGIAHDMNNVLAAILGLGSALRQKHAGDEALSRGLETILTAGERGRDLVRRLTDFARKELEEPRPLDLNDLVRKESEILQRTTLQKVQMVLDLLPDLPKVMGEPSALGNVLMNICVNALDAMPQGGILGFRTSLLPTGAVVLEVSDTGTGMGPSVLAKAMEPFFTTKSVGKGTGLGLASVYGAMKAHGGHVELQSEEGLGTTVLLSFPALEPAPELRASVRGEQEAFSGALRVLLVDDDPIIRNTMTPMLELLGHAVRQASRGQEALEFLDEGEPSDIMILDQNMPGLTGVQTLERLRRARPTLPVILSTGFMEPGMEALPALDPCLRILRKPFTLAELNRALGSLVRPRTDAPFLDLA